MGFGRSFVSHDLGDSMPQTYQKFEVLERVCYKEHDPVIWWHFPAFYNINNKTPDNFQPVVGTNARGKYDSTYQNWYSGWYAIPPNRHILQYLKTSKIRKL
jgi:hypothetical protein